MKKLAFSLVVTLSFSAMAQSIHGAMPLSKAGNLHGPDCSGSWPTNMSFVHMKNAGLVNNKDIDFSRTKTVRIASQKIGKDLWHQVYLVTFTKKASGTIEAIAVHDASTQECSMTGVEVFVISKRLGEK
jgi:hypothetical protein